MASVTGNGSKGHHSFTLEVVENSYDINNNSSEVGFTFKISPRTSGYNWSGWGSKISYKVTIDETEYTGTIGNYNGSSVVTLKSGTQPVGHNNDGTKTINFSFSVTDTSGQSYTCGNASGSSTLTLTTIPRTSSISSITGGALGQNISISISRASTSFTHKVWCELGGRTQVFSNNAGDSASGTLSMDFAYNITGATSSTATMYLETYNNGTYIGTSSTQFTMGIPNSVIPSISSVTKSDTANLISTYGAYVQGKSNLRVQTSASGTYGSSITSIIVNIKDSNNNLLRQLSGSDVTLNSIGYVGTLTIEVIVTDSRGRQAPTNSSTISVAGYNNPRVYSFTAERRSNDSVVTLTWSAEITNINNNNVNTKTFKLYKRQNGQSSWGSAIETYTSTYTWSNNNYTITCSEDYGWEFLLEATDNFTSTYYEVEVGTGFDLINWGADGTSMAIGKVSEKSNTFEVGISSDLKDTSITGGLELFHQTPYIDFHFGESTSDYTSRIIEESSGTLGITNNLHIDNKLYYGNGGSEDYAPYGFIYDSAGNMRHKRSDGGDNFGIDRYDGTRMFYYWMESGKILNNGDVVINGSLKTSKFFIYQLQANYYGEARYYKLAYIPQDDGANACQVNIKGSMGNWTTAKATIDIQISNRGGLFFYGSYIGHSDTFGNQQIRIFREDNGGHTIYLYTDAGYTGPNTFEITGSGFDNAQPTIFTDYSYTTSPSGQWVQTSLKENMVNVSNSDLGSFSCNKDSGNGNVTSAYYWVKGELVQLEITFNTSGGTTAVGSNVWKGTLSGIPLPKGLVSGCGFYSSTLYVGSLETNGTFTIRVLGTTSAQNTGGHVISIVYIRQ